ncbi:MAG TPA: TetR/AcrR family transcriptional regulator [bacterium]|jgi:AcrR family transcriptional regulator|nr:TetR/AcrR family transcriptional regulator [bacterium]
MAVRDRPGRRPAEAGISSRSAIVAAATRLFARRGFAETSMRQIAEAAGVSKAAIYHHFRDKDRLYRSLLEEAIESLTAAMKRVLDDGPAAAALARAVALHLQFAAGGADLVRVLVAEELRADPRKRFGNVVARHREEELAIFQTVLERGIARGEFKPVDPVLSAQALSAVIHVLDVGMLSADQPLPVSETVANMMDVLLNGLGATGVPKDDIARYLDEVTAT